PVIQRRAAWTAAVEPGKSECDRGSIGQIPGVEAVQIVGGAAEIVLQTLRVAERGFLVNAVISAKTEAIQGIVPVLVQERVGALVVTAERGPDDAVAVVIHAERKTVHGK